MAGHVEEWYQPQIPRQRLRELMRRSDAPALRNFGLWLFLLGGSGYVAFLSWGTWWAVPAFLVYGTLYSSSDARWHDCSHGTPFRTRWINEMFYHICSFMTLREAHLWRWSHSRHHTHTIIIGRDPEAGTRPPPLLAMASNLLYLHAGFFELKKIFLHACGILSDETKDFVPQSERGKMIFTSQVYVAVLVGVVAWAVFARSFLPLMFVATPRFYGGTLFYLCALTQHAGLAENVHDHRLNTRTVYLDPFSQFIYFNMNYHIEHHIFPMVPFHALPQLHEEIKDQLPRTYRGLTDAYREIVPLLLRQAKDPSYFLLRELPQNQPQAAA